MIRPFQTYVGGRYPPALDADLDGADAGLSTLKTQSLEGAEGGDGGAEGQADGEEVEDEEEEEHRVLPSTKEERREAKRKLKEEEKKLKVGRRPFLLKGREDVVRCQRQDGNIPSVSFYRKNSKK